MFVISKSLTKTKILVVYPLSLLLQKYRVLLVANLVVKGGGKHNNFEEG